MVYSVLKNKFDFFYIFKRNILNLTLNIKFALQNWFQKQIRVHII